MKRDAVKENVRLAALEKVAFFSDLKMETKPNLKNAVLRIT